MLIVTQFVKLVERVVNRSKASEIRFPVWDWVVEDWWDGQEILIKMSDLALLLAQFSHCLPQEFRSERLILTLM